VATIGKLDCALKAGETKQAASRGKGKAAKVK
jgi:hypothetical protein